MGKLRVLTVLLMLIFIVFAQSSVPKIDGKLSPKEYDNYANFSNGDFRIFWKIVGDEIYILMIGRTKGWVSLGLDPKVKAGDADYITGWVKDNKAYVLDYFAPEKHFAHSPDEKLSGKNDILEFAGSEDEEFTYIEFKRKLDTKDKYDRVIPKTGKLNIIWALGPNDDPSSKHIKAGYGVLSY